MVVACIEEEGSKLLYENFIFQFKFCCSLYNLVRIICRFLFAKLLGISFSFLGSDITDLFLLL